MYRGVLFRSLHPSATDLQYEAFYRSTRYDIRFPYFICDESTFTEELLCTEPHELVLLVTTGVETRAAHLSFVDDVETAAFFSL